MFVVQQLQEVYNSEKCQADMLVLRQALAATRLGREPSLPLGSTGRLAHFVEAVIASSPDWRPEERHNLCRVAAEASELLATTSSGAAAARHLLRAVILYEFADMPAMAAGVMRGGSWGGLFGDFLGHRGAFLNSTVTPDSSSDERIPYQLVVELLQVDALRLAEFQRAELPEGELFPTNAGVLGRLARYLDLGLSASDLEALAVVVSLRRQRAVRANLRDELFEALDDFTFPVEFFPAQLDALRAGLLDRSLRGWGFAAPTGTGKTFMARLLILAAVREDPDRGVIYLVPTRALVHEVSASLRDFFANQGIDVVAVTPQLISLADREEKRLQSADVAVLTPEKADLLLRLGSNLLERCQLVVVDEAHHLESGTRGALLELYLVRLRRLVSPPPRVVMLSAVTPNIEQLARWSGQGASFGTTSPRRATRMRPGVFRVKMKEARRRGWIDYADGTSLQLIAGTLKTGRRLVVQVAEALRASGPVLVVAKGKSECEKLAGLLFNDRMSVGKSWDVAAQSPHPALERLDSRLRRELYEDVPLRRYLEQRVAYHHAGLPPRVRIAVEEAIRHGLVDVVFATTTLAEGVNFPFSSVLVQSLALREPPERGRPSRYHPVTPRSFWNIAGRAGRPGIDHEGQVILFEPSLGLDKVGAVLDPYLNPELMGLEPVHSALKAAIENIRKEVVDGRLDLEELRKPVLSTDLARATLGAVNLVRVAIVHGSSGPVRLSPEEIVSETLAYSQSGADERRFLIELFTSQEQVLKGFFSGPRAPEPIVVAELGLSIDTLTQFDDYVSSLEDWQLRGLQRVMRGGEVNLDQAKYVFGPVAKRMGELEGRTLGGLYGEVATHWVAGVPLQEIRRRSSTAWNRLEELVSVIYSRVQYLLPWGLYAFDRIVEAEAERRQVPYNGEIRLLAYLADAGVPSFDALRLVDLEFERVDSTRMAAAFREAGGLSLGLDVVGWLQTTRVSVLEAAIRGTDRRELDYDFRSSLMAVRP